MKTALRLGVAAVLAGLAVVAVLVALDARSWRSSLATGDAVYDASPARASWTPSTHVGGLAENLLDVRDEVRLRDALRLYRIATAIQPRLDNAGRLATARSRAQTALAAVARDRDPHRRAQALTLLGVLAFGAVGQGTDRTQVDAAESDFVDAIRADPLAEPAKFDLELLLRSTAAHGVRIGPGLGGGFGKSGHRGAGGGVSGRGY